MRLIEEAARGAFGVHRIKEGVFASGGIVDEVVHKLVSLRIQLLATSLRLLCPFSSKGSPVRGRGHRKRRTLEALLAIRLGALASLAMSNYHQSLPIERLLRARPWPRPRPPLSVAHYETESEATLSFAATVRRNADIRAPSETRVPKTGPFDDTVPQWPI